MGETRRRVGIVLPNGPAYFARIFMGIGAYCRHRHNWTLVEWPSVKFDMRNAVRSIREQRADGVIGMASGTWQAMVRAGKLAFVNAEYNRKKFPNLPRVGVDEAAVGRLASEHFRKRGLRHVAAVAQYQSLPSMERIASFEQATRDWCPSPARIHWKPYEGNEDPALSPWLQRLPRPIGIFCWNDETAKVVHQRCRLADIRIPEEVALLGVDNDEAICDFLEPQLSSIDANAQRIGYESAALLDRLMDGQPAPVAPILVPPIGVVTRASTDMLAADAPAVVSAVRFIREHAQAGLTVEAVTDHLAISRRSLEKQFKTTLGRSPRSEIHRVLSERAQELLTQTDLSIPEVADRCGYAYPHHFTTMFRKQTGQTPSAYRKQTRLTGHR